MNKLVKRLITFIIGIPALVIVTLMPYYHHLPINIAAAVFTAIGAVEFSSMLKKKYLHNITKAEAFIYGALIPSALILIINFNYPEWILPLFIITAVGWILISRIFSKPEKLDSFVNHLSSGFALIIYPGFFISWIPKMTVWENAGAVILVFLMIPLGSDSLAWLTGTLFGKNNRGIIAISPNKSIAGFIGGLVGSTAIIGVAMSAAPDVFVLRSDFIPAVLVMLIFGICTGLSTALGDLAESAIKRSCGVKDSGKLMQGRGGILDTIDSIAFTAPVYYALFNLFFAKS